MRAVRFNTRARAYQVIKCPMRAIGHVTQRYFRSVYFLVVLLVCLANVPAFHVVRQEVGLRVFRRDGDDTSESVVVRHVFPFTRSNFRRAIIFHASAIYRASYVTGEGLFVPTFFPNHFLTFRQRRATRQCVRIKRHRHGKEIARNLYSVNHSKGHRASVERAT